MEMEDETLKKRWLSTSAGIITIQESPDKRRAGAMRFRNTTSSLHSQTITFSPVLLVIYKTKPFPFSPTGGLLLSIYKPQLVLPVKNHNFFSHVTTMSKFESYHWLQDNFKIRVGLMPVGAGAGLLLSSSSSSIFWVRIASWVANSPPIGTLSLLIRFQPWANRKDVEHDVEW